MFIYFMADTKADWNWKPKFFSEFSMGELDFRRFDGILKEIDRCSGMVNSCQYPTLRMMQDFLANLKILYDYFKPLISYKAVEEELEGLIKEGINLKRIWERAENINAPFSKVKIIQFVDKLNLLKTKLYTLKQYIGLGIVVKRAYTASERISSSFGRNKSKGLLPEQ